MKPVSVCGGVARGVDTRTIYLSKDRRALLIGVDTLTKYLEVDFSVVDSTEIEVVLARGKRTLHDDRRAKRPTVVNIPLPRKGQWLVACQPTHYGCLVFAICPETT